MRLLLCRVCETIEELPDYTGPAESDAYLNELVRRHHVKDTPENLKHDEENVASLMRVEDREWESYKPQILKQINEKAKQTGFDGWVYESFNTYAEDALKCFRRHNRPKEGCRDYRDPTKLIGHPTEEGRKAAKENFKLEEREGPSVCQWCLSGETEVITRLGTKRIDELARQGSADLLIPGPNGAFWQTCEVKSFGKQFVSLITLKRGRRTKTIRATSEHDWYLYRDTKRTKLKKCKTTDLKPGDKLWSNQTAPLSRYTQLSGSPVVPSAFAIAQGFVFGDGTDPGCGRYKIKNPAKPRTTAPALVRLYGEKDKAMLPYFASAQPKYISLSDGCGDKGYWEVRNLPRAWKQLPDLTESKSFLLGWLAGYFAADGTVDKHGYAALESGSFEHLAIARDICYHLGIDTNAIKSKIRLGNGKYPSPLFSLWMNASNLPESFWLLDHHRKRVAGRLNNRNYDRQWTVVSVESSNRITEVFCAIVPKNRRFILADNLVTGNCPVHTWVTTMKRFKAGMYKE